MVHADAESSVLPKEVVICRFGSAYSTLTIVLLDKKIHDGIQEILNELDAADELEAAVLSLNERVCYKDHDGYWVRARIKAVQDDSSEKDATADIILEDTKVIFTRVKAKYLVAMPEAALLRKRASTYFIEGLEPYKKAIAHKDASRAVSAQNCADFLNEIWPSNFRVAVLKDTRFPRRTLRAATRSRIFVASVVLEGNTDIRQFIKSFLKDYVIRSWSDQYRSFNSVRHHAVLPNLGTSVLAPYVAEKEICEVISLRKKTDRIVRVGLRLQRYLDQELLFERLLSDPVSPSEPERLGPLSAVVVISEGRFSQRGVLLESGIVLCVDTLEFLNIKEEDVELRAIPRFLGDALPHLGLFIDWDTSATTHVPRLGDYILVTNLRPKSKTEGLLQYVYDDVAILADPTVIGCRVNHAQTETPLALGTRPLPIAAQRKKPKKKPKTNRHDRMTLAEWYALSPAAESSFSRVSLNLSGDFKPRMARTLLSEFGETLPINEL